MRVFKWNAGHAVYLPEIDAEHRAIFSAAGDVQKAVEGNVPVARILEGLHRLLTAAENHFAHQERLMQETHYSSFSWRARQLDAALKRLKQFAERIGAGEEGTEVLMLEFLSNWMRDHLAVADRMMGAHLRNHRREHAA